MKFIILFKDFYLRCLILLFLVGIPFILMHQSSQSIVNNYSFSFIIFIIIPFILMLLYLLIELKMGSKIKNIKFFNLVNDNKEIYGILIFLMFLPFIYLYSIVEIDYCGTLLLFLSICFLLLILDKLFNYIEFLLIGSSTLMFGLLLFITELVILSHNNIFSKNTNKSNIAFWGDENTFNKIQNDQEPFISAGGRLLPNLDIKMFNPGLKKGVDLVTNSIGFRNNKDYSEKTKNYDLRILSLGDSFSTGYHVDQKLFFGSKLQNILSEKIINDSIEVLNAEISDPVYGSIYLKQYLEYWDPDIVLFGTFSNDVMQAEHVLGPDRLFKIDEHGVLNLNQYFDSTLLSFNERYADLKYPIKRKQYELTFFSNLKNRINRFFVTRKLFYFLSLILINEDNLKIHSYAHNYEQKDGHKRLFDGSNNLGLFYKKNQKEISKIYSAFFESLSYMNNFCLKNNTKFILMNHPLRYQVQKRDWEIISNRWNLNANDFDLNYHNKRLNNFCLNNNIYFIDPIDQFRTSSKQLYQPNDSHYNESGHLLAAKITAQKIFDYIK